MAEFKGFVCDRCTEVWTDDNKTRMKMTFTGFDPIGPFVMDFCPNCVEPPESARPTHKRNRRTSAEQDGDATG